MFLLTLQKNHYFHPGLERSFLAWESGLVTNQEALTAFKFHLLNKNILPSIDGKMVAYSPREREAQGLNPGSGWLSFSRKPVAFPELCAYADVGISPW